MGDKQNQAERMGIKLSQLLATLTTSQIRFIIARQEFPTDKEAARSIRINPNTVAQWKHSGIPIDEAVRLMVFDGLETALILRKRHLAKAMAVKVGGLDEKSAKLRQDVATEIIEWEMGRAVQRQEHTGAGGEPIEIHLVGNVDPDAL
jgi:hypothetical protein